MEKVKNLVIGTIRSLASSQGFYSRLYHDVMNADEDSLNEWLEQFEDCTSELDVIYKSEC